MMRFVLSTIITVFFSLSLHAQTSIQFYVEKHDGESVFGYINKVFVEDSGTTYLIERDKSDWYEHFFHKKIVDQVDLDGDGIEEGILQTQGTGNCCGPTFFIIKRFKKGFYSILEHDELEGWPGISFNEIDGEKILVVYNSSYGADNVSDERTISHLRLTEGKIELMAKFYNAAFLNAELDITSRELKEIEPKRKVFKFDLDLDGKEDELNCGYWWRWGAVSCGVTGTKFGEFAISGGCNSLGVLSSITNGMHDLVCGRKDILKWSPNKKKYVWD